MKTKKTCVSLAPKDGMMAYYGGRDDSIAFALDLSKLSKKDNKYIFSGDAWSNLKWWWSWKYDDHKDRAVRSVTNQQLKNDNKSKRRQNNVPSHNERIVRIHKQALCAIIVSTRRRQDRINGLLRKLIFKYELGIDLPIILAGKLSSNNAPAMPPEEYTVEQQLVDLYIASKTDLDQASKKIYDKVAKHYDDTKGHGQRAKKSFCRTLVNSNRINWATVFKHVDDEHQIKRNEFKQYIKSAAKVELGGTTSRKFLPTHFVPR